MTSLDLSTLILTTVQSNLALDKYIYFCAYQFRVKGHLQYPSLTPMKEVCIILFDVNTSQDCTPDFRTEAVH